MRKNSVHMLYAVPLSFTFILLAYRFYYSEAFTYLFLIWNLFLAWIPLMITLFLPRAKKLYLQIVLLFGWLIFFPNALYLVTDFIHLKQRPPVPLWFDIILLFSAVLNGMIMAFISLNKIEAYLRLSFSNIKSNGILFCCLFLSSYGIYLGRFVRLNSWDILFTPSILGNEILPRFSNPYEHLRTWCVTVILTFFFSVFYYTIKKIPTQNKM